MNVIYLITFFALFYVTYRLHRDISILKVQMRNQIEEMQAQETMNEVFMGNDSTLDTVVRNHKEVIEDLYRRLGGQVIEVHHYTEATH